MLQEIFYGLQLVKAAALLFEKQRCAEKQVVFLFLMSLAA
jgi:hypothetical protein